MDVRTIEIKNGKRPQMETRYWEDQEYRSTVQKREEFVGCEGGVCVCVCVCCKMSSISFKLTGSDTYAGKLTSLT